MPTDVILKLTRHYSQAKLSKITEASVSTLQYYRRMGWLKPTRRTEKRDLFSIKAYEEAVRRSAEHTGEEVTASAVEKPQKLKVDPNFFDELEKSLGLKPTKKRKTA